MKRGESSRGFPVVFSMGDPHGIGPEVILKALQTFSSPQIIHPIIFGDPNYLRQLGKDLGFSSNLDQVEIITTDRYQYPPPWGKLEAKAGHFSLRCLNHAAGYCRDNNLPLLVTGPVNKRAIHLSGASIPGQTELVASFFPSHEPVMAFFSDRLRVLLTTVHIPLREVPLVLDMDELVRKTETFIEALRRIEIPHPRLALCGLNPHASEEGLFGTEEKTILEPAVQTLCRRHGPDIVSGPFPSDTVFRRALENEFDGVIALYHDQGLIPLKLVAFESAVNVTLGLPLVRTSPDHGTAFEIAGLGVADSQSMEAAIKWGIRLASPFYH
ncbi:4-hydroxythreonine-4-phosphate dehydrogenase PdxA, partial [Acidobacteria bacterium AH-259-D05]|nr:4-hydroxythreonine-4-phosphate dehydrogenase PdxA [Acidobacteria bacterium AH-259-D05]